MPTVNIPSIGDVEFPDSMDEASIQKESARLYTEATTRTATTPSPVDQRDVAAESLAQGPYTPRVDPALAVRPEPQEGTPGSIGSVLGPLSKGIPLQPFSFGEQLSYVAEPHPGGEGVPALRVPAGIVKGVENVATGAGQFMTSPLGFATLGLGAAPGAVRGLASAAFATDMLTHAPDAWQKYWEAAQNGDKTGQAEALTEGLGTLAMAGLAGSHAYAEARAAITLPKPSITQQTDQALKQQGLQPKEKNASQVSETAAVYGRVREQPGENAGQVPVEEGGPRVQPQAQGRIQENQTPLERAIASNVEQGLPANVIVTDELGPEGAIAYPDDEGNIMIHRDEMGLWLAGIPEGRREGALKSLLSEEGIHGVTRQVVTDTEAGDLWNSLTGPERALVVKSYTGGRAEFSPAQMGQEYIRREMQRLMRTPIREIAEGKGFQRLTDRAIDIIERVILAVRRALKTAPSKQLDALLTRMQDHIDANKEFNAKTPGDQPFAFRRNLTEEEKKTVADDEQRLMRNADFNVIYREFTKKAGPAATDDYLKDSIKDLYESDFEFRQHFEGAQSDAQAIDTIAEILRRVSHGRTEDIHQSEKMIAAEAFRKDPELLDTAFHAGLSREDKMSAFAVSKLAELGIERPGEALKNWGETRQQVWEEEPNIAKWIDTFIHPRYKNQSIYGEGDIQGTSNTPFAFRRKPRPETSEQDIMFLPPTQGGKTPQERPGAAEAGALPFAVPTPEIVSKAADEALQADSPSFKTFSDYMAQRYNATPGQLREHWEDAVWRQAESQLGVKEQDTGAVSAAARNMLVERSVKMDAKAIEAEGMAKAHAETAKTAEGMAKLNAEAAAEGSRALAARYRNQAGELARRARESSSANLPAATAEQPRYRPGEFRQENRIATEALGLIEQAHGEGKSLKRKEVTPEDVRVADESGFREDIDAEDPNLPKILTEGAAADRTTRFRKLVSEGVAKTIKAKAAPASSTKRLVALEDTKTGRVELVSTYADKGNYRIVDPRKTHLPERQNVPTFDILKEGRYKPIASVLLDEPVKNFHQRFESLDDYERRFATRVREDHRQATLVGAEPEAEGAQPTSIFGTSNPMTDTEAGAFLDFAHDTLGNITERSDFDNIIPELKLLIDRKYNVPEVLGDKGELAKERARETSRARLVAVALEKAVRKVEAENPELENTDAAVTKALDQLYEAANQAQNRDAFVQAIVGRTENLEPTGGESRVAPGQPPYVAEAVNRRFRESVTEAHGEQLGLDAALAAHLARNAPQAFRRSPGKTVGQTIKDILSDVPLEYRTVSKQLAGEAAPRTSLLNEDAGNALVRYAASTIAAPEIAKGMSAQVLGDRWKDKGFRETLGAVLVEDRLRAIQKAFQDAGDMISAAAVQSVIGKDWSPLKTEADFRAALANPEIQGAIRRHKAIIEPPAAEMHRRVGGSVKFVEDTGEFEELPSAVAGPGLETGAFVNLRAIMEDEAAERLVGGAPRGNLENPLRRKARFSRQARGTGEEYEIDYRRLAERMIEANYEEFSKVQMYDNLVAAGLAQIEAPGLKEAPIIGGRKTEKFTIERRGAPAGKYAARTFIRNLWVREDVAPELRQALNVDGGFRKAALIKAANFLNAIQLAGPTDAVWHVANMISSITGSQGGKNLLTDIARKIPGLNVADALGRVGAAAIRVMRDSPEIQQRISEIAEIGALREPERRGFSLNKRFIAVVDRAGRLVRDDLYMNLVNRGVTRYSEAGRREFINQIGSYNGRLMSQFQRTLKDFGAAPFVVAGRNFNRMAMRRLTFDPGVKAASPAAWAQMRGVEIFGTVATLIAIPALLNFLISGTPSGPPGVKIGQIYLGRAKDGSLIVLDPAQWTGLRRGLRITGAESLIEGLSRGERSERISHNMIRDIIGGISHPWTGPAVQAVAVGTTGYSAQAHQESMNPYDYGENVKSAAEALNPIARAFFKGGETGRNPVAESAFTLAGAAGLKEVRPFTANQEVRNLLEDWQKASGTAKPPRSFEFNDDPSYVNLRNAVTANNITKARQIYGQLLVKHTEEEIAKQVMDYAERPISGSKKTEADFVDWLGAKGEAVYEKAKEDRLALSEKILDLLDLPNPKRKKRGR